MIRCTSLAKGPVREIEDTPARPSSDEDEFEYDF